MKLREIPGGFVLIVDRGEDLVATLTEVANSRGIGSGTVSGIGALEAVTLGYFDCATKEYDQRRFEGEYELISLNGNISLVEGAPFAHLHCTLGGSDYAVVGGHLFAATVAVTAEIFVRVFDVALTRAKDEFFGLNLLA